MPIRMRHDLRKLLRRGRVSHGRQGGQYGRVTRADAAGSDSAWDGTPDASSIADGRPGHRQVLSPTARHAQRGATPSVYSVPAGGASPLR